MTKIELIREFTRGALHGFMASPWRGKDGGIAATNGHVAIIFPERELPEHGFKEWNELGRERDELDMDLPFKFDGRKWQSLDLTAFREVVEADRKRYGGSCCHGCPACFNGVADDYLDCGVCGGRGEIVYGDKGSLVAFYECKTRFAGRLYNWNYLVLVLKVIDAWGGNWIYSQGEVSEREEYSATSTVFSSGTLSMAVMECKA